MGQEPMSLTSVAITAQYPNVHQCMIGTIIIQTVHILQHDSVDTGSMFMENFFKQKQPSPAVTVTPP
jgi:hypothetical protein